MLKALIENSKNNKEELKKTYQEIINKLSPLTDEQKETLKRDIEKDGLFVKELDDGKLLVVKEIKESVEGDKIAQDYIDSKNANYEANKQNEREVKLELAKQGITESLEDITKEKVEEIAKRNNVPIRFLDDTGIRFALETTDKELANKFYKEFSELAGTKETIVVEDVDTQCRDSSNDDEHDLRYLHRYAQSHADNQSCDAAHNEQRPAPGAELSTEAEALGVA